MSATTAGAVKAHLEAAGTGIPWFRDLAPQDQALPFGTIQEGISLTLDRDGDHQDPNATQGVREGAQVTIFQAFRGADGKAAEDFTLVGRVIKALHGTRLVTSPTTTYGVTVRGRVRQPRVDARGSTGDASDRANIVQDVLTIEIARNL